MSFLSIVSVQFNAVFPTLNKSREACSIEIFLSTTEVRHKNVHTTQMHVTSA